MLTRHPGLCPTSPPTGGVGILEGFSKKRLMGGGRRSSEGGAGWLLSPPPAEQGPPGGLQKPGAGTPFSGRQPLWVPCLSTLSLLGHGLCLRGRCPHRGHDGRPSPGRHPAAPAEDAVAEGRGNRARQWPAPTPECTDQVSWASTAGDPGAHPLGGFARGNTKAPASPGGQQGALQPPTSRQFLIFLRSGPGQH